MRPHHSRRSTKDTKTSKYSSLTATSDQAQHAGHYWIIQVFERGIRQGYIMLGRFPGTRGRAIIGSYCRGACVHHQHFARLMSRCRQVHSSVASVDTGSCQQNIAAIKSHVLIGIMIDDPTPLGLSKAVSYGWWEVHARMSLHTPTGTCQLTLSTS